MSALVLALDFGGTKLSAAIASTNAREWRGIERIVSPSEKDARYEYATMLAMARRLLNDQTPAAIGVSFGGPVDATGGLVLLSHHVPGWENMPLRDRLSAELGAPVAIDNDANVAALGESKYGAGQECASMLYVTVSTGVGGGWIVGGKIYRGADGVAGEIGHTVVDPRGPVCVCGRRGCVEVLACGPAIARLAQERMSKTLTAEQVARAARAGDPIAQGVMDDAARALGFGIGTAITLVNPARVVIGGGVSKAGEHYFDQVRAAARANCLPQMRVEIVPAALGDDAPLWGAIALALDNVEPRA